MLVNNLGSSFMMALRLDQLTLDKTEAGRGRLRFLLFLVELVETHGAGPLNYSNIGSKKKASWSTEK